MALRVAHVLKAIVDTHPEFDAALTRDANRTVTLKGRTDLANARDGYLVSIHCNAAGFGLSCRANLSDPSRSTSALTAAVIRSAVWDATGRLDTDTRFSPGDNFVTSPRPVIRTFGVIRFAAASRHGF